MTHKRQTGIIHIFNYRVGKQNGTQVAAFMPNLMLSCHIKSHFILKFMQAGKIVVLFKTLVDRNTLSFSPING